MCRIQIIFSIDHGFLKESHFHGAKNCRGRDTDTGQRLTVYLE